MRTLSLFALFLSSLAQAQGPPRTWIVDFFDAADSDFGTIQEAVDAATDGDTILVRPGATYDGFTVVDKSLVITAEESSRVKMEYSDEIEVRDLAAGKTVLLRGLGADETLPGKPHTGLFRAADCDGTIWLEDCYFSGQSIDILFTPIVDLAASFTRCLSVVVVDCRIEGAPAVQSIESGMHILSSAITGTAGPEAGLDMQGSFTYVSGSTIAGGAGVGQYTGPCPSDGGAGVLLDGGGVTGGGGGPPLVRKLSPTLQPTGTPRSGWVTEAATNASEFYHQDTVITGGTIDSYVIGLCVLAYNNLTGWGVPGPAIDRGLTSLVKKLPGTARTTTITPLARDGATLTRTITGEPGDLVYFFQSDEPEPVFEEFLGGSVFTPPSTPFTVLGTLGPSGTLTLTVPASLALSTDGTTYEQALFVNGAAATFTGSPATTTALNTGVLLRTGVDCNGNGFDDADDLATGVSLDCNGDGVPDECQPFTPVASQEIRPNSSTSFGFALARDGDTLVVGAPGKGRGSAFVFERVPAGPWVQAQELPYSGASSIARLGHSVAIEGDTLVVGLPTYTDPNNSFLRQGQARVYERGIDGTWTLAQEIDIPVPSERAAFGKSLVLEDGELLISAPDYGFDEAVYAFRELGGTWTHVQTLQMPSSNPFGEALSLSEGVLAIGEPNDSGGTGFGSGSVHLYELQGSSWNHVQTVVHPDTARGDQFGESVALRGDRLVVGAWLKERDGSQDGVLYAYERDPMGTWQPAATSKLVGFGFPSVRLGTQVGLAGDVILAADDSRHLACYSLRADGRWPRYETTSIVDTEKVDAILHDGDQVLVGISEEAIVRVFEIADLLTPHSCLSLPTPRDRTLRERRPQAR